ncbi:MAG: 50S ribosomal protein L22 [Acidimicrobiales bacterium]
MTGPKTNEREGTRAVLRNAHMSAYKVREVLDLVRGLPVQEAADILRFSERDAARTVGKLLASAVANAENNDELDPESLYVSACYADEGTTAKRWRPRARGRATRIRKRTSHITVIVSQLEGEDLERLRSHRRVEQLAQRARRVAGARRSSDDTRNRADRRRGAPIEEAPTEEAPVEEAPVEEVTSETGSGEEATTETEEATTETPDAATETAGLEASAVEQDGVSESEPDSGGVSEVEDTEEGDDK